MVSNTTDTIRSGFEAVASGPAGARSLREGAAAVPGWPKLRADASFVSSTRLKACAKRSVWSRQERRNRPDVFDAQRNRQDDGRAAVHFSLRDLVAIEERAVPPADRSQRGDRHDPEGVPARGAGLADSQIADRGTADDHVADVSALAADLAITRVDESEH